ncbi:hypothetical protein OB03_06865 [Brevundimonas sp. GN22]
MPEDHGGELSVGEGIDKRIPYYTRGASTFNFGDYLSEYFVHRMLGEPFVDAAQYRLVGSAISDALVDQDLRGLSETSRLAFWCCGARGEEGLSADRQARCDFWGVRGPLTRRALGLPEDTPLGDPGFLIPLLYTPKRDEASAGKTAVMVHFSAKDRSDALKEQVGADVGLSPAVTSMEELERLFDQIASVDFLLTASLHGAIIACALGTPFAFWTYGEIDVPFKWEDTAALLGIEAAFHETLEDGRRWWEQQQPSLMRPALVPMLSACPFAVRPLIWQRAFAADAAAGHPVTSSGFDRDDWIALARQRNAAAREERGPVQSASVTVRSELAAVTERLSEVTAFLARRAKALDVDFRQTPTVNFADQTPGHALLTTGWTAANDVAPWSLPPFGEIVLRAGAGWEEADTLSLSGYLYAPALEDGRAERTVWVWLNEVLAFEYTFTNTTGQPSMVVDLTMPIAPHLKMPRDLVVRIYLNPVPTPAALGVFEDNRPIGLAPLRLTVS